MQVCFTGSWLLNIRMAAFVSAVNSADMDSLSGQCFPELTREMVAQTVKHLPTVQETLV